MEAIYRQAGIIRELRDQSVSFADMVRALEKSFVTQAHSIRARLTNILNRKQPALSLEQERILQEMLNTIQQSKDQLSVKVHLLVKDDPKIEITRKFTLFLRAKNVPLSSIARDTGIDFKTLFSLEKGREGDLSERDYTALMDLKNKFESDEALTLFELQKPSQD